MGPITLIFLSALVYLSLKGRLGTYLSLATTPATPSTSTSSTYGMGQSVPGHNITHDIPETPAAPAPPDFTPRTNYAFTPFAFPKTPTIPAQNPLDIQNLMPEAIFGRSFVPGRNPLIGGGAL